MEKMITISVEEYEKLKEDQKLLEALKWVNVDNWDGWDYAMEILNGEVD